MPLHHQIADEVRSTRGNVGPYPRVQGRCPSCRLRALFLGADGYVTCGNLNCSDPMAADVLLSGPLPRLEAQDGD